MNFHRFLSHYVWGHRRFLFGIAVALAFCLSGQVLLTAISDRFKKTVQRDAANFLAADFVFQSSVRPTAEMLSSLERLKDKYELELIRQVDIVLVGKYKSTPINLRVRILEGNYPFYGDWKIQSSGGSAEVEALKNQNKIFVELRLKNQGMKEGDILKIAGVDFSVAGFIEEEPQAATSLLFPGSLVVLHRSQAENSGLWNPELRSFYRFLFQWNHDSKLKALSDKDLQKRLREEVPHPHLRLITPQKANRQAESVLKRLLSFLNVLQLVGWVLGSLGVFMILRHFLWSELPSFLLLRCLGLSRLRLWSLFLGTAAILVLLATLFGAGFGLWAEQRVALFLSSQLDVVFEKRLPEWLYMIQALGVSALILLPSLIIPLAKILNASGSALLGAEHLESDQQSLGDYMGLSFVFLIVTYFLSQDWLSWLLFWGLTLVLSLLFAGVYWLLRTLLNRVTLGQPLALKLSWLQFVRRPAFAQSSIIGMGSSLTLIFTLWFIGNSYLQQIDLAEKQGLPNLISVNVSDEDYPIFQNLLGAAPTEKIAIVQGRLLDVEVSKEISEEFSDEDSRERFLTREYTMTLRKGEHFRLGERLVKGKTLFGEAIADTVRASVSEDLAKRMNWDLGTRFRMNVAGVDLNLQIQSLRKIQWFNLQPNFFIVLNEEDVPGIPTQNIVLSTVARSEMPATQSRILKSLPQVTPLDTLALSERLLKIFRQISQMVFGSLLYSFFAGGLLFVGSSLARRRSFTEERALGWALGMSRSVQKQWVLSEAVLLAAVSVGVALIFGVGAASLLSHLVFEMDLLLPSLSAVGAAVLFPLFGFVLVHAIVQK